MPGIFEKAGFSSTDRLIIFIFICIPIRLSLAYSAHLYHEKRIFQLIALISAAYSLYTNSNLLIQNGVKDVVWSRKTHIVSAIMIILSILTGNTLLLQYILTFDVFIGASQYLIFRK